MTLAAGSRLGPYEVLSPIGAGGMGEVYKARDTRLGRDVAIKVLPTSFSQDADRLRRFEQEARAASALNHPNIVTLHDVGEQENAPYVVTELLEGETLRSRLASGALSPRKASEFAIQIAQGLAAAHEKGIVHRDLKPENLFITEDGRVKILDFGLAKLIQPDAATQQTSAPTASLGTEPGVVMGTAGYMSPEQVRGQSADHRSDIFSFGAILYEMLSGRRAFRGDSAVETMSAILKEEPPDLSETNKNLSPGLERLVRHCLEKAPAQRFQSARDLAYDLESLSGLSGAVAAKAPSASAPRKGVLLAAGLVVLAGLLGWFLHQRFHPPESPAYQQVTFRRGVVFGSRFAPDEETIVYAAAWNGQPFRVFSTRVGSTESRDLGLPDADLLSISSSGELAICIGRRDFFSPCTLASVPLAGGAPRSIADGVAGADWAPNGKDLAIVRRLSDRNRIEFPVGKVLYETPNGIFSVRFSPRGDLLAFAEENLDYASEISVVDLSGKKRALCRALFSRTLAWRPDGQEIVFGAAGRGGFVRSIHAVNLSGRQRLVRSDTNSIDPSDISRSGRLLLNSSGLSCNMAAVLAGEATERNVSWLDYTTVDALSPDGLTMLFDEWGEGGGPNGSIYLWRLDQPAPVRLGEGLGFALSPDGQSVLATAPGNSKELLLLPTGTGQPRSLGKHGIEVESAAFLPDGKAIVFGGRASGRSWRLYEQSLAGGPPNAISEERLGGDEVSLGGDRLAVSPDGKVVACSGADGTVHLYPTSGGPARPLGSLPGENPIQWSSDSAFLYVYRDNDRPARVYRIDVASGRREPWKTIGPGDLAGVQRFTRIAMTPDAKSYVYSVERVFGTLYFVDGLR